VENSRHIDPVWNSRLEIALPTLAGQTGLHFFSRKIGGFRRRLLLARMPAVRPYPALKSGFLA
jgi:hypothetical protein